MQKLYNLSRQRIQELVLPIISLHGLRLPGKNVYYRAFDLYVAKNISFADAYNAAYALSERVFNVYSWDRDFDKIEGIIRLEPEEE